MCEDADNAGTYDRDLEELSSVSEYDRDADLGDDLVGDEVEEVAVNGEPPSKRLCIDEGEINDACDDG